MTVTSVPHRRENLLTGEWVLVSPQRTQRPWQGLVDEVPAAGTVAYDPECYLCPGNQRAAGRENPAYEGPFVFDNDFPALLAGTGAAEPQQPLLRSEAESGCCRVICFSERHDRHLADMSVDEIVRVLSFVAEECRVLAARPEIAYVLAFENRGAMMGCSNPHPHGQVWATSSLPNEPQKELHRQKEYWQTHGRSLLGDYVALEIDRAERVVAANEHAVSLVPWWATWPFETLLVPAQPTGTLADMPSAALEGFAHVFRTTLRAYDRLFSAPMPYSMGFHPRPADHDEHPEWQLHAHIYPPLLRSATVRKHMVGFEMLGMPQRDLTPESAAERIRSAVEAGSN